jgi:hypothetical protein
MKRGQAPRQQMRARNLDKLSQAVVFELLPIVELWNCHYVSIAVLFFFAHIVLYLFYSTWRLSKSILYRDIFYLHS